MKPCVTAFCADRAFPALVRGPVECWALRRLARFRRRHHRPSVSKRTHPKDARPSELLRAIEVVAAGDAMISPQITRRLIAEFAARRDPATEPPALPQLTDRERQVLTLIARGLSNDEIAQQLTITTLTAKTHLRNILRKSDCRDRAALTALAYENRLIAPGDSQ